MKELTAFGATQRLRAFKALVVAGPVGLTPGAIAEQLVVAPNALSFHLEQLTHADMVTSEARGRNLIYRAGFNRMNELLAHLTELCCKTGSCLRENACSASLGT